MFSIYVVCKLEFQWKLVKKKISANYIFLLFHIGLFRVFSPKSFKVFLNLPILTRVKNLFSCVGERAVDLPHLYSTDSGRRNAGGAFLFKSLLLELTEIENNFRKLTRVLRFR